MQTLSSRQKQYLKGVAHDLKPIVMIGDKGLTESVLAEIDRALNDHELIKVRISGVDRETRTKYLELICNQQSATAVQTIGRVLVIYRPSIDPKLCLPKA